MRIRRKNGERFDARFYLSPLIDLTGRQTGWMASITDITEPKRVRAALESAHERFEAVLDGLTPRCSSPMRAPTRSFANLAFKRIHGFDAVGRTVRGWRCRSRARRLPRRSAQPVARRRAARALRRRIAAPAVGALVPRARAGHALGGRARGAHGDRHRHHRPQTDRRGGARAGGAPAAHRAPDHHGRDGLDAGARAQPAAGGNRELLRRVR